MPREQFKAMRQYKLRLRLQTNASGTIWWLNLELMQVEPPLVGEITQVQMLYPGSVVPLAMFFLDLLVSKLL